MFDGTQLSGLRSAKNRIAFGGICELRSAVPGPPVVLFGLLPEDEAVLVALAVRDDDVTEFPHHVFSASVHQVQSAVVVRFRESVFL